MKRPYQWLKAYGRLADFDFAGLPPKYSNVRLARLQHCKQECSFCFPHGWETTNSTLANCQRSWKRFRRTQWKPAG